MSNSDVQSSVCHEQTNQTGPECYLPIGDYALIGDCRTAALISRAGSIDWYCLERFDHPAVLCRLLDAGRGGFFRVSPSSGFTTERRYRPGTNILETTFTTRAGEVRVVDLMPIHRRTAGRHGQDVAASGRILRWVEGIRGIVALDVAFKPSFDFARAGQRPGARGAGRDRPFPRRIGLVGGRRDRAPGGRARRRSRSAQRAGG